MPACVGVRCCAGGSAILKLFSHVYVSRPDLFSPPHPLPLFPPSSAAFKAACAAGQPMAMQPRTMVVLDRLRPDPACAGADWDAMAAASSECDINALAAVLTGPARAGTCPAACGALLKGMYL